jgi:hypothetical protein
MLLKAAKDFEVSPDTISFLFVLPDIPSAPWYHLTKAYYVAHRYSKEGSAHLFSRLRDGTYAPDKIEDAGSDGGPDRVLVQECPHDVLVLYRNATTAQSTDDYVKAHVHFGHYGSAHIVRLLDAGVRTGLDISPLLRNCNPHVSLRGMQGYQGQALDHGWCQRP